MHSARYNVLRLELRLEPAGPLLIKAGGYAADPSLPDMSFVRTARADGQETVYIPGSSVKGVLRGFVEQALRTIDDRQGWMWACPTFPSNAESCGKRLEKEERSCEVYRQSCGACRLFGHTRLRGRLAVTDLMPAGEVRTETRYGVAISRLSHAVAQGGLFEMEVAVAGRFAGRIILQNYELWQLGMLAVALDAANHGVLKFGFGKNRGYGEVRITIEEAGVEEALPGAEDGVLRGAAEFLPPEKRAAYGLRAPDRLTGLPQPVRTRDVGFATEHVYDAAGWKAIAEQAKERLVQPAGGGIA